MMLKMIKLLFLSLFLIIILLFSFLYSGIKIDSFSFANILISQFYIKMDKKLILNIENIELKSKKTETTSSFDELKKDLESLPMILKLFQKIDIERLKIADNEFKIILDEDTLYLDNKFVNISSKIDISSSQVTFDLNSLYLKDVELLFDGKIKVDYFNEKMDYFGKFYYQDIQSNINVEMTKKLAKFYLVSEPFKSLKFLKKIVTLAPEAEAWMYDNVEGDIKLQDFYGEFDLEKNELVFDSLRGNAQIEAAKIRFHKDVDVVNTKSLDISFEKDSLAFKLIEPTFKDKSLDGSFVTIHNLTSEKLGEVEVFIKANTLLDKDILDILKAYDINLPLVQTKGNTDASLQMIFPYEASKPMITKGVFLLSDADILINKFGFSSKSAEVLLNDSMIEIKNADFKHKNMIDALVNINLDTKTLKSEGSVDIKSFLIAKENKEEIVNVKNKTSVISMDFNNEVNIELKDLETTVKVSDLIYVDIKNLSKIYPYSKLLKDISIKDGDISLTIKDDKNISFTSNVKGLEFPIEKDGKLLDSLNIKGLIEDKKISISSDDEKLKVEVKDQINIYLKDLDVVIDSKKVSSSSKTNMNIFLDNSKLKIDDSVYELKNAKVNIKKDEIDFNAFVINLDIPLKKNDKKVQELTLEGTYTKNVTKLNTKNKDLILELKKDLTTLKIDGYDVLYSTESTEEEDQKEEDINVDIIGKNSNIFINEKYKFLADNFDISVRADKSKYIHIQYKKTDITIKKSKDEKIDIFSNDINDEFVNAIFGEKMFEGGNLLLLANGDINNLSGKVLIKDSNIANIGILSNLLLFIQTSPALINPFLAIPSVVGMATSSGFNLTAYKIINGSIEFNYSKEKELLDITKLVTVGNGIDFDGKGKVNLNDMTLTSDIKLVFLKDYSTIVGAIPVVNFVLLGDNNRVETKVNVFGDLANPKISTNLTKDAFSVPMNIVKRILTSPGALLDFVTGKETEEEIENKENMINKPLQ